jgi:hypothetical protein
MCQHSEREETMADPARPEPGAPDSGARPGGTGGAPGAGPGSGMPRRQPRVSGGDGPWPAMDVPLLERVLAALRDLQIPQR